MKVNLLKKEKLEMKKTKWDEEDSFRLIEAVTLYGKNWGKVISILQNEQHRFVTLNANEPGDRKKLRTHYNNQKKNFCKRNLKEKNHQKNLMKNNLKVLMRMKI